MLSNPNNSTLSNRDINLYADYVIQSAIMNRVDEITQSAQGKNFAENSYEFNIDEINPLIFSPRVLMITEESIEDAMSAIEDIYLDFIDESEDPENQDKLTYDKFKRIAEQALFNGDKDQANNLIIDSQDEDSGCGYILM